jgi:hypothetical protein
MNDWSTHLIHAEKLLRLIEDKLLHKRRDDIKEDVYEAIGALYSTLDWAENNPEK